MQVAIELTEVVAGANRLGSHGAGEYLQVEKPDKEPHRISFTYKLSIHAVIS